MRTRLVSAVLAVSLIASVARPARAEVTGGVQPATLLELVRPAPALSLTSAEAMNVAAPSTLSRLPLTAEEIRLSRGAKTAIIVGAIVVGVLLIVGVVAVAKPHKLP